MFGDESYKVGFYVKNLIDKEYVIYFVDLVVDWNGLFFFWGVLCIYGIDYKYMF